MLTATKPKPTPLGVGCYHFYDPDENVVEVYAKTPYKVPQPFSEDVDLDLDDAELMRIAETGVSAEDTH